DVYQPLRGVLPHQPGNRGQGLPGTHGRGRPLQAARRRHVRQSRGAREPARPASRALRPRCAGANGPRGSRSGNPSQRGDQSYRATVRRGSVMTTLEARNLTLKYGDVTAVEDVTFALPDSGIVGLIGRNASGKTSLLSVLAGFRKATAGEAR